MHHKKLQQLQRQERILLTLKKLDYLTTSQLQAIHGLKSLRNAQKVIKGMEQFLSVIKDGENVYYLNAEGRAIVDCQKIRKSTGNIRHFTMRNSIYIRYGKPATWRNEIKITSKGATKKDTVVNVADALFKRDNVWHIVEVDNEQRWQNNGRKMANYRELVKRGTFGEKPPLFIWVTALESRKAKLAKLCEGLNVVVYTVGELL